MHIRIQIKRASSIVLALTLAMTVFSFHCGKEGDGSVKAQQTNPQAPQPAKLVQTQSTPSEASQRLSRASTDGNYAYVLFYELNNSKCITMEEHLDSFAGATEKNVEIIKVDRLDSKNRDIVTRLRTRTAPIPLTLLFAPNGSLITAFTKIVTEEDLEKAFPSPKKRESLKYLRQSKGVILCFFNEKMSSRGNIRASCSQAIRALSGKVEYIEIDLSDAEEAGFIRELRIDSNSTEPVTLVINPQGQVTGKYDGEVQVANLVQAATRIVQGGCCPPSSGKTCP